MPKPFKNINETPNTPLHTQSNLKLIVLGYGSHGKGTFTKIAHRLFGFSGISVSQHNFENVIYPLMKDTHGYQSAEECYNDRRNHRDFWFNAIYENLKDDLAKGAREIFSTHSIMEGVRKRDEFYAATKAFPEAIVIWIDASERLPIEASTSNEMRPFDAHIVLDNNGTEADLERQVKSLFKGILLRTNRR